MISGISSAGMDPASRTQAMQYFQQNGTPPPELQAQFEARLAESGMTLEEAKAKIQSKLDSGQFPGFTEGGLDFESIKAQIESKLAEQGMTLEDLRAKAQSLSAGGPQASGYDKDMFEMLMQMFGKGTQVNLTA